MYEKYRKRRPFKRRKVCVKEDLVTCRICFGAVPDLETLKRAIAMNGTEYEPLSKVDDGAGILVKYYA